MKRVILFLVVLFLVFPAKIEARENNMIDDWYIKEYQSRIVVNKDSSLDITEKIIADCGNLPDKHGIYRVIPYMTYGDNNKKYLTPIKLRSITNKSGKSLNYSELNDRINHTVTWKIGDPNISVKGENEYVIDYHVENAIRFENDDFDEFYWNIHGNFWEIETDKYSAEIVFPSDFDAEKTEINLYSGEFASKLNNAQSIWREKNILAVSYDETLKAFEGITLSITYPKNYFTPYVAPWYIKYQWILILIIPAIFLMLFIKLWQKFGRDPSISPTIAPEFEIPENLSPLDMGLVYSDSIMKNNYLTASIVNMAVKGVIKIEETSSGLVFKSKDYIIKKTGQTDSLLSESERFLLKKLVQGNETVTISDLKDNFYKEIPLIRKKAEEEMVRMDYLIKSSRLWQYIFIAIIIILVISGISAFSFSAYLAFSLLISAVFAIIFTPLMTRRSELGAKLFKRIKGLRLYMVKAEKYRQQFNEKENIFEKYLPYAIMFGIVGLWLKNMKAIYGQEYFNSHIPLWYIASGSSFDIDSFGNGIKSLSNNIGTTLSSSPSSSGSGGGGFSGGGGGGGGGGGW